ncbi:hypothetical protein EMGBS2_02550 [Actinomycetota bacterium]|nr:hypothetical protein EMGBS2_02550 [Actinomycetota bacterium]
MIGAQKRLLDYTERLLSQINQYTDRQTIPVLEFKEELKQRLSHIALLLPLLIIVVRPMAY